MALQKAKQTLEPLMLFKVLKHIYNDIVNMTNLGRARSIALEIRITVELALKYFSQQIVHSAL